MDFYFYFYFLFRRVKDFLSSRPLSTRGKLAPWVGAPRGGPRQRLLFLGSLLKLFCSSNFFHLLVLLRTALFLFFFCRLFSFLFVADHFFNAMLHCATRRIGYDFVGPGLHRRGEGNA